MNREYNEAMEELQFSEEAKARMARNLAARSKTQQGNRAEAEARARRGGKPRWRAVAACAAAVALVSVVGGGAYATGSLVSVQNIIDDLFVGAPAQTEVVNKIGRPIGASATSNGVTITADAILGDKRNYVAVFSIAKDDGTAFDVEAIPGTDGLYPLGFDGSSLLRIDGVVGSVGSGHFYDADPSDNAIQYAQMISVSTPVASGVIGRTARASFANLSVLDDQGGRVIAEGTWNLKFTVDYEDTSIELPAGQSFDLGGMSATIDALCVSPIAITIDYTVNAAMDLQEQKSGQMSERNASVTDRFLHVPLTLTMRDGSTIDATDGGGSSRAIDGATAVHKGVILGEFVNMDDIVSVTVGDAVIPLP